MKKDKDGKPIHPLRSVRDWKAWLKTFLPVVAWLAFGVLITAWMFAYVDLSPKVESNLFFSNEDPQLKEDTEIRRIFSQPEQIIVSARGDLHAAEYYEKVRELSEDFLALPEVFTVQSLTHGPDDVEDALKSPLWQRVVLAGEEASFVFLFLKEQPKEDVIRRIEKICEARKAPGFELMISGGPHIVEMIRRNLFRDLKVFSATALALFSLTLLFLFRSVWIVVGTVAASVISSTLTLIVNQVLQIEMGFLTANLSTIVFVLTLSHISFMTADWKQIMEADSNQENAGWKAAFGTLEAALWSTGTALLGFLSLFFVQAKSLRQFGIAGAVGVLFALFGAYVIYPWFLNCQKQSPNFFQAAPNAGGKIAAFLQRGQRWIFAICGVLVCVSCFALNQLNTDPSLFTYFQKNGDLRNGLEYIDHHGGSNPLNIVVSDPENPELNTREAMRKMWALHEALEKDPAVGNVVSTPLLLAEAKRSPLTFLMTNELVLDILGSKRFGDVAKYFITEDRKQALFTLRMNEGALQEKRLLIVDRIKGIVQSQNFNVDLVGGVFMLQGRLAALVSTSLLSGGALLNIVILAITFFLARSLRVSLAMLISLYFVPIVMFGILGWFRVPLDVISAPAVNLALGMGVDSMIHMVVFIKRKKMPIGKWDSWAQASSYLLEPIFWSTLVVCAGFAIFMLSTFPPTQRFGMSVVIGTILTPFAALFILPYLGGAEFSFFKNKNKRPRVK
ncbi:MAG TPA: hypothetical protein DIS66_01095 [Candidatus Omnitrophica bacterium]|nr:hypothetical protein [Candidatus Omnitrophota bacterium]